MESYHVLVVRFAPVLRLLGGIALAVLVMGGGRSYEIGRLLLEALGK